MAQIPACFTFARRFILTKISNAHWPDRSEQTAKPSKVCPQQEGLVPTSSRPARHWHSAFRKQRQISSPLLKSCNSISRSQQRFQGQGLNSWIYSRGQKEGRAFLVFLIQRGAQIKKVPVLLFMHNYMIHCNMYLIWSKGRRLSFSHKSSLGCPASWPETRMHHQ